jgi:hypothetical protein
MEKEPIRSHDLAKKLLEMPDMKVIIPKRVRLPNSTFSFEYEYLTEIEETADCWGQLNNFPDYLEISLR